MTMLQNRATPNLPPPPKEYDQQQMQALVNVIRLFFDQLNAEQVLTLSGLIIHTSTLPTQASLANLRSGTVYVDTSAGNVLKIKP